MATLAMNMHPFLALIWSPLTDAIPLSISNFINKYLGETTALNLLSSGLQNTSILVTMKDYLTVLLLFLSPRVIGNSTLPSALTGLPLIPTKGVVTFFSFTKSTCSVTVASHINKLQELPLSTKNHLYCESVYVRRYYQWVIVGILHPFPIL